jgi:hypothetical protein
MNTTTPTQATKDSDDPVRRLSDVPSEANTLQVRQIIRRLGELVGRALSERESPARRNK